MSDLTDLELCKRIADIEGLTVEVGALGVYGPEDENGWCQEYNPLTDKALLFDLMVNYEVAVTFGFENAVIHCKNVNRNGATAKKVDKPDIPRAILTAIVEANT